MGRRKQGWRLSRNEFIRLSQSFPQIFWIAGADGKLRFLSERFTEMTGMDAAFAIRNDAWKSVVLPEDLPSLEGLWGHARQSAGEVRVYFRVRRRDGQYRWMHSVGRPVLSPKHGGVTHWVGGLSDVDSDLRARRSIEELNRELKLQIDAESEELARIRWRFRSLFHDRNIGVIEIDLGDVKTRLDGLRAEVGDNLPAFLNANPAVVDDLIGYARTVEINPTLISMLGFEDDGAYLLRNSPARNLTGGKSPLRLAVQALAEGKQLLKGVAELNRRDGRRLVVAYAINISSDFTSYSTLVDITEQERIAEMRLAAQS